MVASPQKILTEIVTALATTVNETVHVGRLRGDMVRYIAKAESSRSLPASSRRPAWSSRLIVPAIGKVLLGSWLEPNPSIAIFAPAISFA